MQKRTFSRKYLGIPYALFLVCFVAAPLIVLFYYAFTNGEGAFTFRNLTGFFTDPNTLGTLFYSFGIGHDGVLSASGVSDGIHPCLQQA